MSDTRRVPTGLQRMAGKLEYHLRSGKADRSAYDMLVEGGDRHTWTRAAQQIWEQDGGVWRDHHLAVAYHARAYDLEQRGDVEEAHPFWVKALQRWARIAANDPFWRRMGAQLTAAMGTEPPGDLVASVRAALPRDLLEPNLTRAEELRASEPGLARLHMTAVRESGFAADVVAEVRRAFGEPVTGDAVRNVQAGRYEAAVDALEEYLDVDPTNPHLVDVLLYLAGQTAEALSQKEAWAALEDLLGRVEGLVRPYIEETGVDGPQSTADPQIVRGLARFEFYRGLRRRGVMLGIHGDAWRGRVHAKGAVTHFERALRRDPDLTDERDFHEAREVLTQQYVFAAFFIQLAGGSDSAVREYLRPGLHGLGTQPDPVGRPELAADVVECTGVPDMQEHDQAIAIVDHLLDHPATALERREALEDLRTRLSETRAAISGPGVGRV